MIVRKIFAAVLLLYSVVFPALADDDLHAKFREISGNPYSSDFELPDQIGNVWRLSKNRGHVVVVNFWATWCAPCLKELPSMRALAETLSDQKFRLLAINVGEKLPEIERFIEVFDPPLDFPILIDSNMQVASEWGVRGVPTTYIIDQRGRLVEFAEGGVDFTASVIVEKLRHLIDEVR